MQSPALVSDIVRGCWIVFVATWLLAAVSTKRTAYRESRSQRLKYWLLLVAAYLLLIRGRRLPYPLNLQIVSSAAPIQWTAAILCIGGLLLALWARFVLGRNWSSTVTLKEGHELVEQGPYRVVRHPIYTGMLAMFLATALVQGHLAGFVGVLLALVSFWIKLAYEEKLMLQQFPERYAMYRRRTKRIIPFVF